MKSNNKSKKRRIVKDSSGSQNKSSRPWIFVLLGIGIVVLVFLVLREWPTDQNQTQLGSQASGGDSGSASQSLKGRWLRPDGGYVLEIRDINPDGMMDVAYFNP